jgi:hypothetical protein
LRRIDVAFLIHGLCFCAVAMVGVAMLALWGVAGCLVCSLEGRNGWLRVLVGVGCGRVLVARGGPHA